MNPILSGRSALDINMVGRPYPADILPLKGVF